jgi:membrane protein implicated in regulation of membrane protease activity
MFESFAKMLLFLGLFLAVIGGIMLAGGKLLGLGRLPGDIFFQKGNFSFYFPVVTSIILSLLLTIILNVFLRR